MLDRALQDLFGLTVAWHAETDDAASKVLDFRWPGVPNLGDITAIDWSTAEPVDLMAGGFPCQPFSSAGKRGGSSDERHLWPTGVLPGIEALMPPVVVLENVPNLLTIESGTVFGRVLADLDRLGYAAAWTVVGACKVGACHHRHRLFVLAVRSADVQVPSVEPLAERCGDAWLPPQQVLFGDVKAVKWPPSGVSRDGVVWALPVETCGDNGVVLLPTPRASDGSKGGPNQRGSSGDVMLPSAVQPARFGKYGPAVRRHELAFNLPCPEPTEPGRNGNPRLAASFPEWMLALPGGWVTDVVNRNAALRIAGNGVFGPVVLYALPTLPTFPAAVALLSRVPLGVAA